MNVVERVDAIVRTEENETPLTFEEADFLVYVNDGGAV